MVGLFLGRYSNMARIVAGVLMILTVLGNGWRLLEIKGVLDAVSLGLPILWAGAVVWVLFNRRAAKLCTDEYRELVARTAFVKPAAYKSPFFWVPFFVTGAYFIYIWIVLVSANL